MIPDAIFDRLFHPPILPPLPPQPGGILGVEKFAGLLARWATHAVAISFRAGVYQGIVAGAVLTLVVIQGLNAARTRKER